ncbi:conserved Plasmodium protein, unknown function [Plasmodium ovale curtisi]|uniref:Uncharacterized protein n=1 Tax=Plasmodium ovale curtisi TaxID=864141 RepID=A0A1A8VNL5_PLAOA|nr:conserved Plasmodium protein, unknown function [Plasmodium ovale curtisi]SBS82145.1 conserved Plasmodium protein, unknown function [Plasmodium ovale curtisi]
MQNKLVRLFPTERCLVKVKNVALFEKEIDIKHFLEHSASLKCAKGTNFAKNEAYVLLHSMEEVSHLMRMYPIISKNMAFIHSDGDNVEIEVFNKDEERIFWRVAKRNNANFYVCCNVHK